MRFKRNIQKSLGISLFPAALITFMLDYGSAEKTFITKISGRESVITGLDGIGMYVKEHGFLGYVVSVLPTFIGILATLIILGLVETKLNEKRKSRHIK
ncbi:hypothetical protein [Sedimenticola selenatireducens]|uniref:hypothetical protein n=1 Tax=Sedimenticola selenatireducens TaxID=191960 RepID=UPI002AAC29BA|nr:hypothetical protein [Sedimenticola selenatireducens]